MRTFAAALIALLAASPALAGHPAYGRPTGQVVVHVDPWSPAYRPAPQAGFVWVDGYWDYGTWVPGYWAPTMARAGYTWVPGYWNGVTYTAGFWRPAARPGYAWVGGRYDGGRYVTGYWAPQRRVVVHGNAPSRPRTVVVNRPTHSSRPVAHHGARPSAHAAPRPTGAPRSSGGARPAGRPR